MFEEIDADYFGGGCAPGVNKGIDVAQPPPRDRMLIVNTKRSKKSQGKEQENAYNQRIYGLTGASEGSFARKHHFNSWLSSVISIPAITMNLQLNISRGSSSSGNWHETRQYWHSWFQQNLPYGIVSGLMNWKHRSSEFRSGT
jgi:hypothetical protein